MTAEESIQIGWAILELMGHRKLAGYVTDESGLLRIDVYTEYKRLGEGLPGDVPVPVATQWYGRAAVYCITASTLEMCVRIAASHQPAPVGRWELPERTDGAGPEPEPDDVELEDGHQPWEG